LSALRIPSNSWADRQVNDLSLRFRNSGYAFILGHELAHIYYRHPARRPTAAISQQYEEEADAFALELMRRSGTIPMGAMLFFEASTYYFPNLAQGRNIEKEAGHPLNARRLQAIASQLQQTAPDYARLSANKTAEITSVRFIASGFQKFARDLNDPEFQRAIVAHAAKLDAVDLARR
jgi:Zn-dependent protease with chaperone function